MDAGVLFRLNSIHQHTGMDVILVLDSRNYFQSYKDKHSPLRVYSCNLFQTASRQLNNLTYIESLTAAYRQYFVNDIEHTENNKCQKCKLSLDTLT